MFIRILTILFSLFLVASLQKTEAQSGDYYLKHFNVNLPNIDNNNYSITQDGQGRMYIANRQGVLRFDGTFWTITTTPGTVLSVKYDFRSNLIYVGCINDYGYIKTDFAGRETYVSLSKKDVFAKNIAKIELFENFVYFLGEDILFEYSKVEQKVINSYKEHIVNFFSYDKSIYACYENNTISKLGFTKFKEQKFNNLPDEAIIFSVPLSETSNILGTINNRLYILNGNSVTELKLKDASYIEHCELLDAVVMDEQTLVIATTKGGCLIVNILTGETKSVVNYYSGLPDNEIYAIGKDASGGVWMAHEFGITRLDYNLPFRCFSNYIGLEGRIETAVTFNGKLYVGTNEGIFMLDQTKQYKEVVQVKTINTIKQTNTLKPATTTTNTPSIVSGKKERFKFRDLFKKKGKQDSIEVTETDLTDISKREKTKKRKNAPNSVVKLESQSKKYVLESVKYTFKKIATGDLKCIQLLVCNNRLLAATNSGIFDVNELTATRVCNDNIRYMYASKYKAAIYASTSRGDVLSFAYKQNSWTKIQLFDFIKQPITYIAEDEKKNIWLSGIDQVYRFTVDENYKIQDIYEHSIDNPFSDDIFITNLNKKIYFSLSSTYYYYDYATKNLVRDSLIEKKFKDSEKILNSQSDILWILKNKSWQYLSNNIESNENHLYLSLFKNVDEMIVDNNSKAIWLITSDNKLYNLNTRKNNNKLSQPNVFVNDVKNSLGQFLSVSNFSVQQNESGLMFDIISTDYYDQNALEYQYKIIGLSEEWSQWSTNNTIVLNYMMSGNYKILVRSRNAIGQITEKEAVTFKIKPPYWQTWWFYLGELIFFGVLWLLSFRLNRLNSNNQVIRKLLTFMTLVLTVEFMSTVAENMININISPVIDFMVKVGIAIILFPFEQLLLRFIAKKQ